MIALSPIDKRSRVHCTAVSLCGEPLDTDGKSPVTLDAERCGDILYYRLNDLLNPCYAVYTIVFSNNAVETVRCIISKLYVIQSIQSVVV